MTAGPDFVPEFSRLVAVARIRTEPLSHRLTADAAERVLLARRLSLLALDGLEAVVSLRRLPGGDIRLDAEFSASLVQSCVVTLDPVPAMIVEHFGLVYRAGIDDDEADRLTLDAAGEDVIEPLPGEAIDIGEAVAQQLSLALDPYPHAPGAELPEGLALEVWAEPETEGERKTPFGALAALKKH